VYKHTHTHIRTYINTRIVIHTHKRNIATHILYMNIGQTLEVYVSIILNIVIVMHVVVVQLYATIGQEQE